jgi:hypothetical protein
VLPAGNYRLRIDTLNFDGSLPPGGSRAHKAMAVRLLDRSGNPCDAAASPCALGALSDFSVYTPVSGTSFTIPAFQLPPSYAGQTIDVDIYDPGDINANGGSAYMDLLDPSGSPAGNATISVLGSSRVDPTGSTLPTCQATSAGGGTQSNPPCSISSGGAASFTTNNRGQGQFNGQWVRIEFRVPSNYNPGSSPAGWYWNLRYRTEASVQATDTFTMTVKLKGAPAHLVSS